MRKSVIISLLLFCLSPFVFGQKTRYGQELPKAKPGVDYPIAVHVSGTRIRQNCRNDRGSEVFCANVLYLDAIVDGRKIELMGDQFSRLELLPGDYQARLLKSAPKADLAEIGRKYEFVLPDKTIWRCSVTGISE
jgi:hypothetical protein